MKREERYKKALEAVHKELTKIQATYAKAGNKNISCLVAGQRLRHLSHICSKALYDPK